jgi:hypothetical protein
MWRAHGRELVTETHDDPVRDSTRTHCAHGRLKPSAPRSKRDAIADFQRTETRLAFDGRIIHEPQLVAAVWPDPAKRLIPEEGAAVFFTAIV